MGQPLEVVKTQMASNRQQTMGQALRTVWSRGGVLGFYQGLIPWVSCLIFCSVLSLIIFMYRSRLGSRLLQKALYYFLQPPKLKKWRKSLVLALALPACWEEWVAGLPKHMQRWVRICEVLGNTLIVCHPDYRLLHLHEDS